jgi:hypothetical protein
MTFYALQRIQEKTKTKLGVRNNDQFARGRSSYTLKLDHNKQALIYASHISKNMLIY